MEENINPFHPDNLRKIELTSLMNFKKNLVSILILFACSTIDYLIRPTPFIYFMIAAGAGIFIFLFLVWNLYRQYYWVSFLAFFGWFYLSQQLIAGIILPNEDGYKYLLSFFSVYCVVFLLLVTIFKKLLIRNLSAEIKNKVKSNSQKLDPKTLMTSKKYFSMIILAAGIACYLLEPTPLTYFIAAAGAGVFIYICLVWNLYHHYSGISFLAFYSCFFVSQWMAYDILISKEVGIIKILISYFAVYSIVFQLLIMIFRKPLARVLEEQAKDNKEE